MGFARHNCAKDLLDFTVADKETVIYIQCQDNTVFTTSESTGLLSDDDYKDLANVPDLNLQLTSCHTEDWSGHDLSDLEAMPYFRTEVFE